LHDGEVLRSLLGTPPAIPAALRAETFDQLFQRPLCSGTRRLWVVSRFRVTSRRRRRGPTVGANSYDAKERQLHFAVRDAEAMGESLSMLDGYKVVPVNLTSEREDRTKCAATVLGVAAVH
jgi:hypothetical protein